MILHEIQARQLVAYPSAGTRPLGDDFVAASRARVTPDGAGQEQRPAQHSRAAQRPRLLQHHRLDGARASSPSLCALSSTFGWPGRAPTNFYGWDPLEPRLSALLPQDDDRPAVLIRANDLRRVGIDIEAVHARIAVSV